MGVQYSRGVFLVCCWKCEGEEEEAMYERGSMVVSTIVIEGGKEGDGISFWCLFAVLSSGGEEMRVVVLAQRESIVGHASAYGHCRSSVKGRQETKERKSVGRGGRNAVDNVEGEKKQLKICTFRGTTRRLAV